MTQNPNSTAIACGASGVPTGGTFRRRGFTFAEILFAVMILGIGFIMIAGVFPVALQQAQMTRSDAAAASVSESATRWLISNANVLHSEDFPPTGGHFFGPPLLTATAASPDGLSTWEHLRGNFINSSDPRYAWVPVFFREQDSPFALAYLFVCESQLDASFIPADLDNKTTRANLYPRAFNVNRLDKADPSIGRLTDRMTLAVANSGPGLYALAPGAFVVVKRADKTRPSVYRLGNLADPTIPDVWELMPGYDLTGDNSIPNNGLTGVFPAYVIGRRGANNLSKLDGPAQDIALYQTTIHLTNENTRE